MVPGSPYNPGSSLWCRVSPGPITQAVPTNPEWPNPNRPCHAVIRPGWMARSGEPERCAMGNPSVAGIAPPPWAVRSIATVGGREVAPPKSHQPACPRRQVIETQPGEANTPRRMICMSACLHARTQPAQPTPGQTVGRADDPYGAAQPPPLRQPKYQDGNPPGGPARPDRTRLGPTEHGAAQPAARQPRPTARQSQQPGWSISPGRPGPTEHGMADQSGWQSQRQTRQPTQPG